MLKPIMDEFVQLIQPLVVVLIGAGSTRNIKMADICNKVCTYSTPGSVTSKRGGVYFVQDHMVGF